MLLVIDYFEILLPKTKEKALKAMRSMLSFT